MDIIAALLLDSILGDPKNLPHPVVYLGRVVSFWEKRFYPVRDKRLGGLLLAGAVLLTVGFAVSFLLLAASLAGSLARSAAEVYLLFTALAFKSLKDESLPVYIALREGDLDGARMYLSRIVGRDTGALSEQGVIRAAVETIAENWVDGVFSVLFYAVIGSFFGSAALPAWLFKAANTMDSMVGYDDARYAYFGRAAARLDDAANFIPARLGGIVAVIAGRLAGFDAKAAWRVFLRDRLKHKSPNSAHAESAYAGLLGISLGGGAFYRGKFEERPFLGDALRDPEASDILRAHKILTYSVVAAACAVFAAERIFL